MATISAAIVVSGDPVYLKVKVDKTNHFCTYLLTWSFAIELSLDNIK